MPSDMRKEAFEKRIEAIEGLRCAPAPSAAAELLRKALSDRNNFVVSKAASVAGFLGLQSLAPDLLAAFDRFLQNPIQSDPQCWAKNAIAKALRDLGHSDSEVFLKGLTHVQNEPVWGGKSDTATTLRGECALALAACLLDDLRILEHLTDALADPETPVRLNVVRAIGQLNRPDSALLLRLKALLGDTAAEVTGQCFVELLTLSPFQAIPFVARFLRADDEADEAIQAEAAGALGQSGEQLALDILKQHWEQGCSQELKRAILLSLAASPIPGTAEFLLSAVSDAPSPLASAAVVALASSRFRSEVREQVEEIVERRGDASLQEVFKKEFAPKVG